MVIFLLLYFPICCPSCRLSRYHVFLTGHVDLSMWIIKKEVHESTYPLLVMNPLPLWNARLTSSIGFAQQRKSCRQFKMNCWACNCKMVFNKNEIRVLLCNVDDRLKTGFNLRWLFFDKFISIITPFATSLDKQRIQGQSEKHMNCSVFVFSGNI